MDGFLFRGDTPHFLKNIRQMRTVAVVCGKNDFCTESLSCIVARANHLHADVLRGNLLAPVRLACHKDITPKCLRPDLRRPSAMTIFRYGSGLRKSEAYNSSNPFVSLKPVISCLSNRLPNQPPRRPSP